MGPDVCEEVTRLAPASTAASTRGVRATRQPEVLAKR